MLRRAAEEREIPMLRSLGAIAFVRIGGEPLLFAQVANQEPGAYAFYHAATDVPNSGRPSFRSLNPTSVIASDRALAAYGCRSNPLRRRGAG
jgi:hypothetical protein